MTELTADFAGATLEGMDPEADPDRAAEVAIHVEGGRHVRILHARQRGYPVGAMLRAMVILVVPAFLICTGIAVMAYRKRKQDPRRKTA